LIPYADLKPQHDALREELRQAIDQVLDSRQFILGKFVSEFENGFVSYSGARHAIAVNSGTSALHLALLAAGVEPGDEVITVPFTFAATVAAVHYCSATPVLVDINPRTFSLDVAQFEAAITPRTKAVMPVHLYGQIADGMEEICAIAKRHGIAVIEDAAQAHGAEFQGRRAGAIGDLGCFSFYPTKNMGACGEGGLVTTNDDALAERVRLLRDWGQDRKYHHAVRGFNYRMEGIQGAVLSVKLKYVEQWTEARRALAARYDALLDGVPGVTRPAVLPDSRHVYHTYTVRVAERDRVQQELTAAGIGTAIHYPIPLHLQPAYADPRWPQGSLPQSETAANEVLSLPIYAEMDPANVEVVSRALADSVRGSADRP